MREMAKDNEIENWVPLVEFSVKKGISLSTLRRYIKANKIPWKLVEGRYLLKDDGTFTAPRNHDPHGYASGGPEAKPETKGVVEARLKNLETELTAANEEIAELKTLVAFYDEKWAQLPKK